MNQAPTQEETSPYIRKQTGGDKSSPYNKSSSYNKLIRYNKSDPVIPVNNYIYILKGGLDESSPYTRRIKTLQ